MFISLLYVILAILGLSFLIFIHELGHYFMARRVGMRIEVFSIGFGSPLYVWEHQGVKWQIGWLLFGGYVKIAGTDLEKNKNPYEVKDGFFGKTPLDRIKVAFMGPLTNLVFALVAFAALWLIGGREAKFAEYTSIIGWVDPASELYQHGVRPGDEIVAYDDKPYTSFKDHIYGALTANPESLHVRGFKVNYETSPVEKTPFEYGVKVYQHPAAIDKRLTTGITQPANYMIYDRLPGGKDNPLPEGSPLQGKGLEYGDRIFWVNGDIIFSSQQLDHILNSQTALLTIENESGHHLVRVPRIQVQEIKPDSSFREELIDWQFAAGLNNSKLQNLYTIPYNITNYGVVENAAKFIDQDKQKEIFPGKYVAAIDQPLNPGDRIIAVNGIPVANGHELLAQLQTPLATVIVQRDPRVIQKISSQKADESFDKGINAEELKMIVDSIGTSRPILHKGNLFLLPPITPKTREDFKLSHDKQIALSAEFQAQRKAIEAIEDPERRSQMLRLFEKQENRLLLGLPPPVQDRKVGYNPGPVALFENVFQEIWSTLSALFMGTLNPKGIVGPIGIVQVVHDTSMSSLREALFWLGAISLNLGILNLLPIPVLDGGTILMSLVEIVTRRRLHPKTMEKLIIPFAVILICFFIYLTYNDISRILHSYWK